jgi:DNA repair protein RecO (recombination protein O)
VASITDNAIVIRRWDFSETSQTVSLFTRGHGIIRALAKGAKRDKAPFSGGLDLLTEGEMVAIIKAGRDLAMLTAWHLQRTHRVLRHELAANRAALYMADLVHHLLIDHDPHPRAFDALSEALATIDDQVALAELATLKLQWAILTEAGYQPQVERDARSGAALPAGQAALLFSAAAGGVTLVDADAPEHARAGWRVRRETIEVLAALASGGLVDAVDHRSGGESVRRANRLLAAYCREIIGCEPGAMRWAFPDLSQQRVRDESRTLPPGMA